jgi:uncharacterized membrane protein
MAASVEYLHSGDTAIVSMQYSYLASDAGRFGGRAREPENFG